ncbi:MAG TPA: hypothetical protein VFA70_05775 [Dehalococcoidia bacterium]|nr:hypothetical protein [Dehalococcoidia bacterium]
MATQTAVLCSFPGVLVTYTYDDVAHTVTAISITNTSTWPVALTPGQGVAGLSLAAGQTRTLTLPTPLPLVTYPLPVPSLGHPFPLSARWPA